MSVLYRGKETNYKEKVCEVVGFVGHTMTRVRFENGDTVLVNNEDLYRRNGEIKKEDQECRNVKVLYKGKVEKYKDQVGTILGDVGSNMTLVDFGSLGSMFIDNKNLQPYKEESVSSNQDEYQNKEDQERVGMKVIYNGSREEYKGRICDVIGGETGVGPGYTYVQLDEFSKCFVDNDYLTFLDEETSDSKDPINPSHYKQGIEVYDFIKSHDMNFAQGNAIKYISRYQLKNGVEDLKKAKWYLEKLIEELEVK